MASQNENTGCKTLDQIFNELEGIKENWNDLSAELQDAKEEQEHDIFAALEYLRLNDQLSRAIYINLKELKSYLDKIRSLYPEEIEKTKHLTNDIKEFRNKLQERWQIIDDEYAVKSEETLRKAQDIVTKLANTLSKDELFPSLREDITQNLDKELFLQELRDTAESYRQERESFISEVEMGSLRKLAEPPEDLGEETPETDGVISQLDTLITSCDMALMK